MADDTKDSEQISELEIALFFTDNNEETAKAMVEGSYKDQYAIKGIFSSSSISGAFLVFFCMPIQYQTNIYAVTTTAPVNDLKEETDWSSFEKAITDISASDKMDKNNPGAISSALSSGMTLPYNQELKKAFEASDMVMINYRFKRLLEEKLGLQQLDLVMAFEPLSSLEIELKSTSASKINLKNLKKRSQEEEKLKETITETKRHDDPLTGKDVKMLLNGRFILSPIKGKNVSSLKEGDRVRVIITDKNQKAIKLAQAFKAFDEKNQAILPVSGRIVSNRFFQKAGYEFYIIIAKGVYLKVMEDKKDIKVALDEDKSKNASQGGKAPMMPVIIWTCLAALIIIGVIIILFV